MHSKKGFLASQMFLYSFGTIVLLLIVYSGYTLLSTFSESAKTSGLTTLTAKLSGDIGSLSLHKGEVKVLDYRIPGNFKLFCVFDLNTDEYKDSAIMDFFPYLYNSLRNKTENVFLLNNNDFYAFRAPELKIAGYPYYSCTDIKNNQISFSAKGDLYNGDRVALMLISNKVEIDISDLNKISNPCGVSCYKIKTELDDIISSDGLTKLIIPTGTVVRMPGTNTSLFIEIIGSGDKSDDYVFGPNGTTFIPDIQLGIKTTKDECDNYAIQVLGPFQGVSCDANNFILFNVSIFKFD